MQSNNVLPLYRRAAWTISALFPSAFGSLRLLHFKTCPCLEAKRTVSFNSLQSLHNGCLDVRTAPRNSSLRYETSAGSSLCLNDSVQSNVFTSVFFAASFSVWPYTHLTALGCVCIDVYNYNCYYGKWIGATEAAGQYQTGLNSFQSVCWDSRFP